MKDIKPTTFPDGTIMKRVKTDYCLPIYSLMIVTCFLTSFADAGPQRIKAQVQDQPASSSLKEQSQESNADRKGTSVEGSSTEMTENEILIVTFDGSGTTITRPFKVSGPWDLKWDFEGSFLAVTIYRADGSAFDIGGSQDGPGKGSSYQRKGGNYYLKIMALGKWEFKVYEIRPPDKPIPKAQEYKPRLTPNFFLDK